MKQKVLNRGETTSHKNETLMDQAFHLDQRIKERTKEIEDLKEELAIMKGKLIEKAKVEEVHELVGVEAVVKFSDVTNYDISLDVMLEWLKKNKKMKLLSALIKPSITDCKKYLGEYSMESFSTKKTHEYSRVSFSKKK